MLKKLTKGLSLLLALCLMVGLLPVGAVATETGTELDDSVVSEEPVEGTESAEPTEEPVVETPAEPDEEKTPSEEPAREPQEEDPDAGIMPLDLNEDEVMPTDLTSATTTGQPFSSGTGGSTNFRIPALITLSNGNLLAAADARYSGTGDGYGLDTIVSYSADNGSTWNYSYVNYFDDSTGYNGSASAFIDPVLIQDKEGTVYLFADLYPGGGYYIANIKSGTGFTTVDGVSYLALYSSTSATSSTTPAYYVANELNSDGYYTVYDYSSKTASNYALDAEYDIYTVSNGTYTAVTGTQIDSSSTTINANVFYTGTANQTGLYVLGTEYITMRKGTVSTDGSITWGGLQLLNVKNSSEYFYGFGPGGGIVTSTGRMIVPLYTYANSADGNTSVIYSDDKGATWTRSADMNVQTSEASISEVTVGGKNYLYMFTRHGGYFVSEDNGATWSTQKSVSGISYTTSCELSTLTYSKLIDGCPAILLSAPTSNRTTGKIFVGLVQTDGSITWKYTYSVNGSGTYQYSDLTELSDGSIGLLYENGSASITYTNLAITSIAPNATIGEDAGTTDPSDPSVPTETREVSFYVGQTFTDTISGYNFAGTYTTDDPSIATVTVTGTDGSEATATYTKVTSNPNWNTLISSNTTSATSYYYLASDGNYYQLYVTRSNGTQSNRYNYSLGYYANGSSTLTSVASASNSRGNSAVSNVTLYTKSGTEATPASTTVTFTGVAAGTTSVVVGNTTYNITVKELPPYVDAETTPFTVGTNYTGAGEILTKLTLSVGLTYDIDLASSYSGGIWSIADTNIATVDQDGKVTGVATGETTLTYTASNGVAYTIPVVIVQNTTSTSTKICSLHITEIVDTTVWYSWNCSGSEDQFIQAVNGEAIYVSYASNVAYCINFYGAPEEGYALTFMSATNSNGQYLALQNKTDPTQCDFYTQSGAGKNERNNSAFGDTKVAADIQAALNLGCDGAQGFSRGTSDTSIVNCDLTFCSRKLPTVDKTIVTVGGVDYTEGMTAKAGDVIVYNVTVTQYATAEAIVYTNETLTDNLSGAKFTSNSSNSVTPSLSDSTLTANQTTTYQVTYTIQDSDLDKDIINTVDLTYSYSSTFSSGTFGGSANAKATISAPTFTPKDIVVDFGLPVTIDYSSTDAHGRYDLVSGTATYGDVTVSGNKVTYMPNTTLKGVDTVTLTNTAGGTYTFKVYPATTVYYEENFIQTSGEVTVGDNTVTLDGFNAAGESMNGSQTASPTDEDDLYGYDEVYADDGVGASNGKYLWSETTGATAAFTFTGTGVDIYTNNTTATGTLMFRIVKSDGSLYKLISVDTVMAIAEDATDATEGQAVDGYNIPVVSLTDLEYDNYSVYISHVKSGSETRKDGVMLDGFRVYGTLNDKALHEEGGVYYQDQEDNPTFIELRDEVLTAQKVETSSSQYADQIAGQVYSESNITSEGAVILSTNEQYDNDQLKDLLDNGPKNEIYLQKDQTLVFKVTTNREVQIGFKALDATTAYTINRETKSIITSTDMFYTVLNKAEIESEQLITITNTGDGILSITKLKICDDPNATLGELTEDDLTEALVALGYEREPGSTEPEVTYADAVLTIKVNDNSTELTANGVEGETATFAAADIKEAAESLVPEGYVLDEAEFTDVNVVYGETAELTFTASEEVVEPEPEPIPDPEPDPEPTPDPEPEQPAQSIWQKLSSIIKKLIGWL